VCRPLQPYVQADEKPAEAPTQRSKAATKRARKKAAKQQAADGLLNELPVAAQLLAANADQEQMPVISCDSTTVPDAAQVGTAAVPHATCSSTGSPGIPTPLVHHSKMGAANAAVQPDWARCSLSGKIMLDPVLFGSGGHSFELEALEEWLAANPGVDPLSLKLLQLGESSVLPNHALRNLIQQLHLA
jgi:U-box domain